MIEGDSSTEESPCLCHCRICQRSSGAPLVAWATFRQARERPLESTPSPLVPAEPATCLFVLPKKLWIWCVLRTRVSGQPLYFIVIEVAALAHGLAGLQAADGHGSMSAHQTDSTAIFACFQEDVAFVQGEPKTYQSSPSGVRRFCGRCGTQLLFQTVGSPVLDITIASMDTPDVLQPEAHIWTESKRTYIGTEDLPSFLEKRPTES